MSDADKQSGFEWQKGIWDELSGIYVDEIEGRFGPVFKYLFDRAKLKSGERVLDLGTGTGQIAFAAKSMVGDEGKVTAVDISPEMLTRAEDGANKRGISNIEFLEGRAEKIPVADNSYDAVLASLSMMYVIERDTAAKEIARILRPSGRFIAAVWADRDKSDIVKFQTIAGSFAPKPPVEGVGPGALAEPDAFLAQLRDAGLSATAELEFTDFEFPNFELAWSALAVVTTANLDPSVQEAAKVAVKKEMWAKDNEPRHFKNGTIYISATKPNS